MGPDPSIFAEIQVSHGFLIAHYMDNSDDLSAQRGGQHNKDRIAAQRKWLAHFLAPRLGKRGSKKDAYDAALDLIHTRLADAPQPPFGRDWYEVMLNTSTDDFVDSLSPDRMTKDRIRELAGQPDDDIPPR